MDDSQPSHGRWAKEKELLEQEVQRLSALLNDRTRKEKLNNDLWILSIQEAEDLKWKAKATEAQAENRDKVIALLKDKLTQSESLLNENNVTIGKLTKEHQGILTKFYNQQDQMEDLQARCLELEIDVKDKAGRIKALTESQGLTQSALQQQLVKERDSLAETIKKLNVQADLQEDKIIAAQTMASQAKKKPTHETLPDEEIRKVIENDLRVNTKTWARTWAIQDLKDMARIYNSPLLRKEIEKFVRAEGVQGWLRGVKARFVVDALLTQYISEEIIQQPLHQLSAAVKSPEVLTKLYTTSLDIAKSQTDVHAWRSRTLQLLNQIKASEVSSSSSNLKEQLEEAQKGFLQSLVVTFLEGPIRPLLRQVSSSDRQQRNELFKVLKNASNLGFDLWKQRTSLEIKGIEYFKDKTFRCDSLEMEAHRVHNLDDNDHHRDGERIMMVSNPAYFAFGNEDGEGYDRKKVWAKAVVWLERI